MVKLGETKHTDAVTRVWDVLSAVPDPEIPVISIVNLGIVRDVREEAGRIVVDITPTYSGCPATETIALDVRLALEQAGFAGARLNTVLSPPWTTDWIDAQGRQKLKDFGIAPPLEISADKTSLLGGEAAVCCPRCASSDTQMISPFGSTPCKAQYKCKACLEPFDYFKCLK